MKIIRFFLEGLILLFSGSALVLSQESSIKILFIISNLIVSIGFCLFTTKIIQIFDNWFKSKLK